MTEPIVVLKFGGSLLHGPEALPGAVHEIYRRWRTGARVVAVVSAFRGRTDGLFAQARRYGAAHNPARAALAALGETESAAQLVLALAQAGLPSTLLDPAQLGLRTEGAPLDARPVALDRARLLAELAHGIVVVPGFAGRDARGATTLLGRGGSDYTALFLAAELEAGCTLLKDCGGLFTADPARDPGARRYAGATWETAARVAGRAIHPGALDFARARGRSFSIGAAGRDEVTAIGAACDQIAAVEGPALAPLRVALAGFGTVGAGVWRHLAAEPARYEVCGIAARNPAGAADRGAPTRLLTADPRALLEARPDLLVELLGGLQPAGELVKAALTVGIPVITANKALLAARGAELFPLAARRGIALRHSAAAGGGLPALELVAHGGDRLSGLEAVLNGTTHFVLERIAAGDEPATAVAAAQAAGFAETDPTRDLDGTDSAEKLALLARAAWGVELPLAQIERIGIDRLDPLEIRAAARAGRPYKLVGRLNREGGRVRAIVAPHALPGDHPFALLEGAGNGIRLEHLDGTQILRVAQGAGRWPTAEAVFADLEDERRSRESESAGWREAAAS